MVSSKAATPDAYLAELPPDRRVLAARLRNLVNAAIPPGYQERMSWGMIGWEVPLERYADTYNRQPLAFAGLAAQKNYTALYLNCVQGSPVRLQHFKAAWAARGKKLDMGKACLRFKSWDDVAEDVLAETLASVPVEALIADYEASRAR
ncbi:MAG TPA: DUF1801 domain-containing protein [Allosphingosinicella sp.]|nr:DUF1801 domain-containing protein [Allosphingosinicella sp.]